MVDDTGCEISDWGYCEPVLPSTIHAAVNCKDDEGWADKDGDNCFEYTSSAWCTMAHGSAVPGVGWHEDDWGSIRSFGSGPNNISAFTACCSCGGGNRDAMALPTSSTTRHTWNSCKCKMSWDDSVFGHCNEPCCNPNHDPYGEWCLVEDVECEDNDWGYCRPTGLNVVRQAIVGCTDTASWKDKDGDDCVAYGQNFWCTKDGRYDVVWHESWGTFDSLKDKNGISAKNACCACGGGNKDGNTTAPPALSVDAGFFVRKTWNDCLCKTTWSEEGVGACASSCCNPDDDPLGEWCVVEDQDCEDSDFGYCHPALLNPLDAVSSNDQCTDLANFKDSDGDGCAEYVRQAWCTQYAQTGIGWHEEWGTFASFANSKNQTAVIACCACGGGTRGDKPAPVAPVGAVRQTWNGCSCMQTWSEGGETCTTSCCNPFKDPYGEWCLVSDIECEDSDWGYCMPVGTERIEDWEFEAGGCTDSFGWKDADGDGCRSYREKNWCNSEGGYNTGWHEEWGTFATFAAGPRHETAPQACCACGRGKAAAEWDVGNTASAVVGRLTLTGCRCLKEWEEEGINSRCNSYCCNPDADPAGEWCFVDDPDCEFSDWGYCMPATNGAGTIHHITPNSESCLDNTGWQDVEGDDCTSYANNKWCAANGRAGVGWHEEWGDIKGFAVDAVSAFEACCSCGGGSIPIVEVENSISKFLKISIAAAMVITVILGHAACYYRHNYNKIAYASPEAATIGKDQPDDV